MVVVDFCWLCKDAINVPLLDQIIDNVMHILRAKTFRLHDFICQLRFFQILSS